MFWFSVMYSRFLLQIMLICQKGIYLIIKLADIDEVLSNLLNVLVIVLIIWKHYSSNVHSFCEKKKNIIAKKA